MEYNGITAEGRMLLAENRFRDSREFYEENKERIKALTTVPMRQIAAEISKDLINVDPFMNTIPTKMVSRVRRDTRFTKDQHMYRENLWIMFMRDKHQWQHYPFMWFEFTPRGYSLGVGLFYQTPAVLNYWRWAIRTYTDEFVQAVKSVEGVGAVCDSDSYKRPQPGCPVGLERYYNCKSVYWMIESAELSDLEDETIINKLKNYYSAYAPMYKFMLRVSDAYTEGRDTDIDA